MSPVTHSTVVVVADDGTSPVGSDEWNAGHVADFVPVRMDTNGVSVTVASGYCLYVIDHFEITPTGSLTVASTAVFEVGR